MAATRHSGLECLRIISIILIVSMHILGNTFHTSNWLNKEFILFINTLGNTGVTLFILISGYFGIRFNTHKFFKMLVVVWFYSIVSYLIETIWLHTPHTWTGLASSLLPILSKKYWFMTCYVVLYCFSPYLNRLVHNLSQKSYKQLLLLWGFFFVFAPTILFFEIQNDTGKGIINVTLAYLIGQYLKTYGLPENMKRHSREILSGSLACIFILNSLLTAPLILQNMCGLHRDLHYVQEYWQSHKLSHRVHVQMRFLLSCPPTRNFLLSHAIQMLLPRYKLHLLQR